MGMMRRRTRRRTAMVVGGAAYAAGRRRRAGDAPAEEPGYDEPAYQEPPPAPPAPSAAKDPIEELQRLAELHDSGALTDDEFTAAKAKILG